MEFIADQYIYAGWSPEFRKAFWGHMKELSFSPERGGSLWEMI